MKETEEMNGVQKTAVLLIAMGPERSAKIFKHLKEEEIEQLTLEIANTRSISQSTKDAIMDEFYQICLAQQYIAEGGIGYAKDLRHFPLYINIGFCIQRIIFCKINHFCISRPSGHLCGTITCRFPIFPSAIPSAARLPTEC